MQAGKKKARMLSKCAEDHGSRADMLMGSEARTINISQTVLKPAPQRQGPSSRPPLVSPVQSHQRSQPHRGPPRHDTLGFLSHVTTPERANPGLDAHGVRTRAQQRSLERRAPDRRVLDVTQDRRNAPTPQELWWEHQARARYGQHESERRDPELSVLGSVLQSNQPVIMGGVSDQRNPTAPTPQRTSPRRLREGVTGRVFTQW